MRSQGPKHPYISHRELLCPKCGLGQKPNKAFQVCKYLGTWAPKSILTLQNYWTGFQRFKELSVISVAKKGCWVCSSVNQVTWLSDQMWYVAHTWMHLLLKFTPLASLGASQNNGYWPNWLLVVSSYSKAKAHGRASLSTGRTCPRTRGIYSGLMLPAGGKFWCHCHHFESKACILSSCTLGSTVSSTRWNY